MPYRPRWLAFALTTVLTGSVAAVLAADPAMAAQTIGYPTFSGPPSPLRRSA